MSLTPGTRLGPYEITTPIGQGGMGVVYRATDTSLGRQVAIKVLPDAVAQDAERLARFEREAKTLAALNHPHIAAIYGFEKSGGLHALVMELVEGEDLSQRLLRGAIPLDESLAIARQVAEAVEAAHDQGIIHRDLKPHNIKVRADGTVKVLDFGLAKAIESGSGIGGQGLASLSPTITSPAMMTGGGMILGTAAYMAPEQAKGKAVDRRADIWAFGVVLHEMLTGRQLFLADTIPETLAHVMTRQIDVTALPAGTPRRIRDLLARCLDKDPKKRLRDIGEARIRLEEVMSGAAEERVSAQPASSGRLAWISAVAIAVVAIGALAIPALRHLLETMPPEMRLDIVTPPTGTPTSFALSPDGRQIVFVATDDKASRLWLRSLSTTTAQPLAATEGATHPFWSPDGRSIGFFAAGALKRFDIGGGAPKTLAPAANGSGGTWNAADVIVFAPAVTGPLLRVPATGGAAVPVTTLAPQQFGHFNPQFLPDGQRFLFTVGGSVDTTGVYVAGLDGSAPTRLVSDYSSGTYAPQGWLLWMRGGSLMAQRFDVDRRALTGEPLTLADGLAVDAASIRNAVSVAETGLVAYRTAGGAQRQLTWFDRSGTARGVVGEPHDSIIQPRVSPDGRRVVMARATEDGSQDLWMLDGARASRFTFAPAQDIFPVWSPDGTRIVYTSRRTSLGGLLQRLTNGSGDDEPLLSTDQNLTPTGWSRDGRFLMYMSIDPKTNADLWVLPMTGAERKPFLFLKTPFREAYGTFSPDGRWVAYHSNESGRPEVYIRPFAPPGTTGASATGGQWPVSTAGGILPMWRADGKELYYVNPDGAMMAAPISVNGSTVDPGTPVMLFPTRMHGGGADIQVGPQYDVTADGRFLINTLLNDVPTPITLLQNWHPEAKK